MTSFKQPRQRTKEPFYKINLASKKSIRNSIRLQNWRNDAITRYADRGYDVVSVINYIDEEILPIMEKKYVSDYGYIRSVKGDLKINTLTNSDLGWAEAKVSVKFPPKRK